MLDTVNWPNVTTGEGRARGAEVSRSKAGAADGEAEAGGGYEWAVARCRP